MRQLSTDFGCCIKIWIFSSVAESSKQRLDLVKNCWQIFVQFKIDRFIKLLNISFVQLLCEKALIDINKSD